MAHTTAYTTIETELVEYFELHPTESGHLVALGLVTRLSNDEIEGLAAQYLIEQARARMRSLSRHIEQLHPNPATPSPTEELYLGKYRHGSTDQRSGAAVNGCNCGLCLPQRRARIEIDAKYDDLQFASINAFTENIRSRARLEVTAELLDTTFQLRTGEFVTWGNATVAQHQDCIDMLMTTAASTVATAMRHEDAIAILTVYNVSTLGDIPRQAAQDNRPDSRHNI